MLCLNEHLKVFILSVSEKFNFQMTLHAPSKRYYRHPYKFKKFMKGFWNKELPYLVYV